MSTDGRSDTSRVRPIIVYGTPASCSTSTRASSSATSMSRTPSAIPWRTRSRTSGAWVVRKGHRTRW
ncbi:Uncharacterised protein [Mycobacteroides abscessus]|nr:Uncharacterised protein [Mycobacteroides abscessus]